MKKKLLLIPTFFLITACGQTTVEKEEVSHEQELINIGSKGFAFKGKREQKVIDLEGNDLFTNTEEMDYSFENSDEHVRTNQTFKYWSNGKQYSSTINFAKSPDGFVSQEYTNYKNEISYYKVANTDGYYLYYDELFSNPFLILNEEDLILVEAESNDDNKVYLVNESKDDLFDYYLTGGSRPLLNSKLYFEGNVLKQVKEESIVYTGKTKDTETGKYIPVTWQYFTTIDVTDFGNKTIEAPEVSDKETNAELRTILDKVNDNFTLETTLIDKDTKVVIIDPKISYFDGKSYYEDVNKDAKDVSDDYYYGSDPFNKDDFLYEYKYDKTSKLFTKTDKSKSGNYNIEPKTKDYFVPHLKEMDDRLFAKDVDKDGYYTVDNKNAIAFIGSGFFSDKEDLPYFQLGYGMSAKIKQENDTIKILIDFYYVYDSTTILELEYQATYSNIGTTVVPSVDL